MSKKGNLRRKARIFLQSEEGRMTRGNTLAMSAALMMIGGSALGGVGHDQGGDHGGADLIDNAAPLALPDSGTTDVAHCSHASHASHGSHGSHGSW